MSKQNQPNIIFIMSDDHAAQAISAYGYNINATPHIDRIAREGARLDHCYVTNSICTPSRASILTGTHNHVNEVTTLASHLDNSKPHVAKHLQEGGYQTAMIGKWHLGTGEKHCPTGFDYWSVLPGQGAYDDPTFIDMGEEKQYPGYVTDIITEKSIDWMDKRDKNKPFFLMCHHKAPHRCWDYHPKYEYLYENEDVPYPETFNDDYMHRAQAAREARMRIDSHMVYDDLGLKVPEDIPHDAPSIIRDDPSNPYKLILDPEPDELEHFFLTDKHTGEKFTFSSMEELKKFKYQRYLKRYLRTIASIDESVGNILEYLDREGLSENTIIMYTSDQGFFLGEHGWFDKRFMYEESFRMPFLVRYPKCIAPGTVVSDIAQNVDFAPTWLDYANIPLPSYMQGYSMRGILEGNTPTDWQDVAYHRYWMHRDSVHNAYAHYGIRDHRYKLIYWYAEPCGAPGASGGGEPKEWELFDTQEDPLEVFNCFYDPAKRDIVKKMLHKLDKKQAEIGDVPEHDSPSVLQWLEESC